jgi:hypothetical protein
MENHKFEERCHHHLSPYCYHLVTPFCQREKEKVFDSYFHTRPTTHAIKMTTTDSSTNAQAQHCPSTSNAEPTPLDMSLVTLQRRARGIHRILPPLPMMTQQPNGTKADLFSILNEALRIGDEPFGSDDGEDSVGDDSFKSMGPSQ